MSIGYPITKSDLDARMGTLVVQVRDALEACVVFKTTLLDDATILTDAFLQGLGYTGSVSSGEIQVIRNSFASMTSLRNISRATATQASTNDFWFDAKHLAGLNFR